MAPQLHNLWFTMWASYDKSCDKNCDLSIIREILLDIVFFFFLQVMIETRFIRYVMWLVTEGIGEALAGEEVGLIF